jgi:hypothetical protein
MDKIFLKTFFFFIALLLLSCSSPINNPSDTPASSYNLDVIDSAGIFLGRSLKMNIIDKYESGKPKTISYILDDTIFTLHLLESGLTKKKETYFKRQLIEQTQMNIKEWPEPSLYKIEDVVAQQKPDTLIITAFDNSYMWFDEYVKWKSDYLIWLNHQKFKNINNIKTKLIKKGKPMKQEFIYSGNEIHNLVRKYSSNPTFDSISSIVLGSFTPTDMMNLRNAHNYMNKNRGGYNKDIAELFYDFSLCEPGCFAEERLRFLGEMLKEIQLDDFWSEDKVKPDDFIQRLNLVFLTKGMQEVE